MTRPNTYKKAERRTVNRAERQAAKADLRATGEARTDNPRKTVRWNIR